MNETNNQKTKPVWFSIKAAAEYLDVGEPTIYRWMKDGQITYRKVGDSTRFLQEDLDSVTKVFPSDKDVDKVRLHCPLCHHDELVEGRAQSTGLVYFKPRKTRFWSWLDSNVETQARMCSRCGVILWFGDTHKLNALRLSNETQTDSPNPTSPAEVKEAK